MAEGRGEEVPFRHAEGCSVILSGPMIRLLDRIVGIVARVALAIGMAMLAVALVAVCYGVAMRYVLNAPVTWADELVGYLLVYIVMLGAAESLRRGEVIAVDVLSERFGRRGRRAVEVFGMAAVVLVGGVLMTTGWDMVAFSARISRLSEGYLAVPLAWTQFAIPLGGGLIALAGLGRLLATLAGRPVGARDGQAP